MRASAGRHEPQLVPAPSAPPIAATSARLWSRIAATIVFSPTSKQTQMIGPWSVRSDEQTSELQSLIRYSYAVFWCKTKHLYTEQHIIQDHTNTHLHTTHL